MSEFLPDRFADFDDADLAWTNGRLSLSERSTVDE